jgi:hypothetical protein
LNQFDLTQHLPSQTTERFKQAYYRTLSDNLRNQQALDILRRNLSPGVPLLVLKGPALIERIYLNPALRPMTDIDLLIHPEHLPILKDCLHALNYGSPVQYPNIFIKNKVIFDIHTDPFHADRIKQRLEAVPLNLANLWQKAIPFANVENLFMLSLPDQILTLSVHALKHGYDRNIWLFDILLSLKLAHKSNTWPQVQKHCSDHNASPILALSLHAIQIYLARNLPAPICELQKSFPIGPIRRKILCASPQSGNFQVLEPWVLSKQFPKRIDQLRFLVAFAFPKRAALDQISGLSGRLHWLSYPYRIVQLLSLGTRQLAKLAYRLMGTP